MRRNVKGIPFQKEQANSSSTINIYAKTGLEVATFNRFNYAYDFLTAAFTGAGAVKPRDAAAGVLANLWKESGYTMDPSAPQRGGGRGEGVAQWTHSFRKTRFREVMGVPVLSATLDQQLTYLVREMTVETLYVLNRDAVAKGKKPQYERTYYNAGQLVLKSTSAGSAATIFVEKFERPGAKGQPAVRSKMADEILKFQDYRSKNSDSFQYFNKNVRGNIIA